MCELFDSLTELVLRPLFSFLLHHGSDSYCRSFFSYYLLSLLCPLGHEAERRPSPMHTGQAIVSAEQKRLAVRQLNAGRGGREFDKSTKKKRKKKILLFFSKSVLTAFMGGVEGTSRELFSFHLFQTVVSFLFFGDSAWLGIAPPWIGVETNVCRGSNFFTFYFFIFIPSIFE